MSPQALSDMNVIKAEYTPISAENSSRKDDHSASETVAAILIALSIPVSVPLAISGFADHNVTIASIAGPIAVLSLAALIRTLVTRARAESARRLKHVTDRSIKTLRVSLPADLSELQAKANPTPKRYFDYQTKRGSNTTAYAQDFMGLTPKEMTRLCEYLGYSPKEMGILKQAMTEKNLNAEQVEGLRAAMQRSRFSPSLEQPVASPTAPPVISSRPGFWSRLFNGFMDGLEADLEKSSQSSRSAGRSSCSDIDPNDYAILLATPDPGNGRRVEVRDRGRLIGSVSQLNDTIDYRGPGGIKVAWKVLQGQGHHEIRNARGDIIFRK